MQLSLCLALSLPCLSLMSLFDVSLLSLFYVSLLRLSLIIGPDTPMCPFFRESRCRTALDTTTPQNSLCLPPPMQSTSRPHPYPLTSVRFLPLPRPPVDIAVIGSSPKTCDSLRSGSPCCRLRHRCEHRLRTSWGWRTCGRSSASTRRGG